MEFAFNIFYEVTYSNERHSGSSASVAVAIMKLQRIDLPVILAIPGIERCCHDCIKLSNNYYSTTNVKKIAHFIRKFQVHENSNNSATSESTTCPTAIYAS